MATLLVFHFRQEGQRLDKSSKMIASVFFCAILAVASGQKAFKPFSLQDLEKYKFANAAEKSDLKVHVAAPQIPKEDLGKIEELCVKR